MNWLMKALSTSVGKKFVMAITGLLLTGFLVTHLAGNLLMFAGADEYNAYAEKLHSMNPMLEVAETALFLMFFVHILLALKLTQENRKARKTNYNRKESKKEDESVSFRPLGIDFSDLMLHTGGILLLFLVLHIIDMKLKARPDIVYPETSYDIAITVLSDPISRVVYTLGSLVLVVHLGHGISSAFQSLGLSHSKYTPYIKCLGMLLAFLIAIGFALLPIIKGGGGP